MTEITEEVHEFEETFKSLGKRIVSVLMKSSFETLEELHEATDQDLLAIVGIGKKTIAPMRGLLAARGYEKPAELDEIDAAAKLKASVAIPDVEHVIEPGRGKKLPRRKGQVAMLINLYDPGFRRKNNDQKLSVRIGDVIWGNKEKEWDLPREKVDELIAKGEAA
jgi:hypothetical protein